MKTFKIFFIASFALLLLGCSDFLDEEVNGALVGNSALSSEEGLEAALTGAYKGWATTWASGFLHSTSIAATMGVMMSPPIRPATKPVLGSLINSTFPKLIREPRLYTQVAIKRFKVQIILLQIMKPPKEMKNTSIPLPAKPILCERFPTIGW